MTLQVIFYKFNPLRLQALHPWPLTLLKSQVNYWNEGDELKFNVSTKLIPSHLSGKRELWRGRICLINNLSRHRQSIETHERGSYLRLALLAAEIPDESSLITRHYCGALSAAAAPMKVFAAQPPRGFYHFSSSARSKHIIIFSTRCGGEHYTRLKSAVFSNK